MKLTIAIDKFLTSASATCCANTIASYQIALGKFVRTVGPDSEIESITPEDIDAHLLSLIQAGYAKTTTRTYITIVLRFFNWLIKRRILTHKPSVTIPGAPAGTIRALPLPVIHRLMETARNLAVNWRGARNLALIGLCLDSACRIHAILSLRLDCIEWDRQEAYVIEKFSKPKTVNFSSTARADLQAALDARPFDSPYAFSSQHNPSEHLWYSSALYALSKICEKADIEPITFHQLRHSWAQTACDHGVPLEIIRQTLGHTSLLTTQKYLNQDGERVRLAQMEVSKILRM